MEVDKVCKICQQPGEIDCLRRCGNVYYCSEQHKEDDITAHQVICRLLRVWIDENSKCYSEAIRDIEEGEIILEESPIVYGPAGDGLSKVCISCSGFYEIGESSWCENCGWPLCHVICRSLDNHNPECYFIRRRQERLSYAQIEECESNNYVLVLRCLYQKLYCSENWEALMNLESVCDRDVTSDLYARLTRDAEDIQKMFKLEEEYAVDEIRKIVAIIATNSVRNATTKGIYSSAFLFEHSCRANCLRFCDSTGKLKVIACANIPKGCPLTLCYIDTLATTPDRQKQLRYLQLSGNDVCQCERCRDPTESATYFNSLKCQMDNCEGVNLPQQFTGGELRWDCTNCGGYLEHNTVIDIYNFIEFELEITETHLEHKRFIERRKEFLCDTNCYMARVKYQCIMSIIDPSRLPGDDLVLTIEMSRQIECIMDTLMPADKIRKCDILYYLEHALDEFLSRNQVDISVPNIFSLQNERRLLLKKITQMYQHQGHSKYGYVALRLQNLEYTMGLRRQTD